MNLDNLSDAQIRAKFIELGVPVGPVTSTTRKIMLKKLKSLIDSGAKPPSTSGEESDGGRLTPKLRKKTMPPPKTTAVVGRTTRPKPPSRSAYTSAPLITPVASSTFIDSPPTRFNSDDSSDNFLPRPSFNPRVGNEAFRASLNASYNSYSSYDSYDGKNGDESPFSSEFLRRLTSSSRSKESGNSRQFLDVKESDDDDSAPTPNYSKFTSGRPSRELSSGKICRQTTSSDSWYRLDSPVSALLLVSFLLFFGAIGVVYINKTTVVTSLTSPRSDINFELCRHGGSHNCVTDDDFPYVELMLNALLSKLDDKIVDASCTADTLNLTDDEIQGLILSDDETLHPSIVYRNLNNLKLVFDSNSKLNVKRTEEGVQLTNFPRPFHCTLMTLTTLIADWIVKISLVFLLVLAAYLSGRWWLRKEARRREEAYKLANTIIEIVSAKSALGADNFVPISHVRDQLIPLKDRVRLRRLWDDALALLESDSRLRKEVQEVEGEHFMVWRWLAANLTNKKKVWQGQAFDTLEGNLNSHVDSPTNCLKIRHMFEAGQEEGDDWVTTVVDAILEKCGSAKILHLVVDRHSPEGLVYMKCVSPSDAGIAYRALHGSWFASNLITVKYIREHRYHERFPESVHCSKPLRPSTDAQRSMK